MDPRSLPKIAADRFARVDDAFASRRPWRHTLEHDRLHATPRLRSGFETLRGLRMFAPVTDGELLKFAALGFERRVEKGRTFLPGIGQNAGPLLSLILEGEAQLAWGSGSEELLLRILEPGDLLGEFEMFGNLESEAGDRVAESFVREGGEGMGGRWPAFAPSGPHEPATERFAWGNAVARAHSTLRLMEWDRENVREALRRWPDVALCLLGGMARRQRALQHRVAGICNQRAPRRLARLLTALAEERGVLQRDAGGRKRLLIRDPPSRVRMAELAGMARETVSRLLSDWERRGWVTEHGGAGRALLALDAAQIRLLAGDS